MVRAVLEQEIVGRDAIGPISECLGAAGKTPEIAPNAAESAPPLGPIGRTYGALAGQRMLSARLSGAGYGSFAG
jgi:hypothetical protein